MLKSMTGFGRGSIPTKKGKLVAEVQSVNRKFLETSILMPREFFSFEIELKKFLAKNLARGQITLRLNLVADSTDITSCIPDVTILKTLKSKWTEIAKDLCFEEDEIDLNFLIKQYFCLPQISSAKDQEYYLKKIITCVQEAIDNLQNMKAQEGLALSEDIKKRLLILSDDMKKIKKLSPNVVKKLKEKLLEKLEEYLEKNKEDERLVKEIAIFAEKVDISEEITRFQSHIKQFNNIIDDSEAAVGRKMDFLIQEMMREINTIGSKSSDQDISLLVVNIKSEIEKIREQVQNIE
jgi:uncharacterized protein (TIGR00255 family)